MGTREYEDLSRDFRLPIVVGGFEPVDLLESVRLLVAQLEEGRVQVENQYVRSVTREGNLPAQRLMEQVFRVCDRQWRGIGAIPLSGYRLRPEFAEYDAELVYGTEQITAEEPRECMSALVLQGLKKPVDCAAFGTLCTPERPLGAPMVSSEGVCAAYHAYRRRVPEAAR
jgi:hydrogenase expression/formation protein HypD